MNIRTTDQRCKIEPNSFVIAQSKDLVLTTPYVVDDDITVNIFFFLLCQNLWALFQCAKYRKITLEGTEGWFLMKNSFRIYLPSRFLIRRILMHNRCDFRFTLSATPLRVIRQFTSILIYSMPRWTATSLRYRCDISVWLLKFWCVTVLVARIEGSISSRKCWARAVPRFSWIPSLQTSFLYMV